MASETKDSHSNDAGKGRRSLFKRMFEEKLQTVSDALVGLFLDDDLPFDSEKANILFKVRELRDLSPHAQWAEDIQKSYHQLCKTFPGRQKEREALKEAEKKRLKEISHEFGKSVWLVVNQASGILPLSCMCSMNDNEFADDELICREGARLLKEVQRYYRLDQDHTISRVVQFCKDELCKMQDPARKAQMKVLEEQNQRRRELEAAELKKAAEEQSKTAGSKEPDLAKAEREDNQLAQQQRGKVPKLADVLKKLDEL